jgi:predicted metal-dependent HD superfamily phosphohydrolase
MFQQLFTKAVLYYSNDKSLPEKLWNDIAAKYEHQNRYYHNLSHLEQVAHELLKVKDEISNWNSIIFSIAYHDIIYDALKDNNEEQSAEYAEKMLATIISQQELKLIKEQILATKNHQYLDNGDTNYFTDADLSILGANEERYVIYAHQIREEYHYYSDFIYKQGRKKLLQHFLDMERIFKTNPFYTLYEIQARNNLKHELEQLNQ